MLNRSVVVACATLCACPVLVRGASLEAEPIGDPTSRVPERAPGESPSAPEIVPPGRDQEAPGAGDPGIADEAEAGVLDNEELFFSAPNRAAYRNLFERTTDLEAVPYIPGETDLLVDVTTVLNGRLHLSMMSFAVVNLNPTIVSFDSRMTFYADAGGAPDLARPIGHVAPGTLYCPPRTAIGVAQLYLDGHSSFELPPGRVWFGVEITNISGGDPALFGQVEIDNVTVGNSQGVVIDGAVSPPAVLTDVANLDRMIIPFTSCRTDWQLDGRVDVRDFAAYLTDYANAPEVADYDRDGVTDVHDYVAFCVDYLGCTR